MSKRLCRDQDVLQKKINGKKKKYICTKCDEKSPKKELLCHGEKIDKKKKKEKKEKKK
jgi:hypothetical protein